MAADSRSAPEHTDVRPPAPSGRPGIRVLRADELPPPDFAARTRLQGDKARERLAANFSHAPRIPWPAVDRAIGHGMLPDQVWSVAASSGHGKTSLVMNLVDAWAHAGHRVYMLPLEEPAATVKLHWAALAAGVHPFRALTNTMTSDEATLVQQELQWQEGPGAERVYFSPQRFVGIDGLTIAGAEAKAFGAGVMIVDYVQRIRADDHQGYRAVVQTLTEIAVQHDLPVLGIAQLHRGDGDPVRPYQPPNVDRIEGGKVLEQESTVVLGLFRPLVTTFTAEDARNVRLGQSPIRQFLEPNTMGIALLKSRLKGEIGDVVKLAYERGRIHDPEWTDWQQWEARHADALDPQLEIGDAFEGETP